MIGLAKAPKDHRTRIHGIKALRKAYGFTLAQADALLKQAPTVLPDLQKAHEERELRRELEEAGLELVPEPPDPTTLMHIRMPFLDVVPNHDGPFCGSMETATLCGVSTFTPGLDYVRTSLASPTTPKSMTRVNCPSCLEAHSEILRANVR